MNERIRELIKEARYDSRNEKHHLERVHNREITLDEYQEIYDKRFAELIVRECMKESMDEIVPEDEIAKEKDPLIKEYLKGNNQGIVDAVIRFRKHFGVE